ncbi:MAG: FAD-dependent oxidoreductase [Candidatus Obscuribacterales bacterium]|nr:FAD-dependent oxidoreductase [Candidatus Obscuribacterales bacterium]
MAELVDGKRYDLIVIGGGAAGLVSSGFAAALGLDVALISDGHPGGECLWTGCVPSKALIHFAAIARTLMVHGDGLPDDIFERAFEHMSKARQTISHHDSVETIEGKYGVNVLLGRACFVGTDSILVNDEITLQASKFIIATGGVQTIPDISGFKTIDCLTHESILDLKSRPDHLLIVGAGPVGCEYAQTFARLGSKVTLVEMFERLLSREEPQTSRLVEQTLKKEDITVLTSSKVKSGSIENGICKITLIKDAKEIVIDCNKVLVATGKTPSTKALALEKAGVETDERGFVLVNEHQATSAKNIWACGDVCGGYQFTHYADHTAQIAALNLSLSLFSPFIKRETRVIPWCTFLDPEVASVGLREAEAREKYGKKAIFSLEYDLADYDRAILDDRASGFIKVIVDGKGKILGATIVGHRAGEIIHEFALAMKHDLPVTALGKLIHVYPTMSGAIGNLSALYYKNVAKDSLMMKAGKQLASWLK